MKLYLSSYRIGNAEQELVALFDGKPRTIAYIPNALDYSTDHERREQSIQKDTEALEAIGFNVTELDLRKYFDNQSGLEAEIAKYSGVFVRGGNCFVLRRAYRQSGFDLLLPELLKNESLIYAAYSAGIDMLAPSLHGVELVDDPSITPQGYQKELVWECLQVLPYTVAPHYKSDHAESSDMDISIQYMVDHHIPFIALRDGEVIVIDGENHQIVAL